MEVNSVNSAATQVAPLVTTEAKLHTTPELAQAVTAVNAAKLFGHDSELTFAMDREAKKLVIRLVDKTSRKVIKQIPPQSVLDLAKSLKQE